MCIYIEREVCVCVYIKSLKDSRDYRNKQSVKVLPKYRVLALINLVLLENTNGITAYRSNDRI